MQEKSELILECKGAENEGTKGHGEDRSLQTLVRKSNPEVAYKDARLVFC